MSRLASGHLGRFVTAGDRRGIGRLAALEPDGMATVRYFRCPARDPYIERCVSADDLQLAALSAHTRVYLRECGRWLIGRIDEAHPDEEGTYLVAFPNSEGRVLSRDDFEVRWAEPIDDPFEILAVLGGDSAAVYEPRLGVISEWLRQRGSGVGAAGLLLGSVELHDHQLTVVRKVSEDATRRYLLADEVGLGKTIEAGALIWQCLHDRPDARIVILAPDHLRRQWAAELTERFRVDEFTDSWLRVRAHDDPVSWPSESVDLLVVDEAHHLTRAGAADSSTLEQLAQLAHGAREVLLLSATPVRSNEAGFLDLLHLLDPANYRRDDLDAFTQRVEMRDRLALTFQSLLPDLDAFDVSLFGEELEEMFPADTQLHELVAGAVAAGDDDRPHRIGQVREHLSETYRLHHRLVRTRRTDDIHASFGVRGRRRGKPFTLEVDDESANSRTELLDEFRSHLAELVEVADLTPAQAADAFIDLATRCGSLPHAILSANERADGPLADWLTAQGSEWVRQFAAVADTMAVRVGSLLVERALAKSIGKVVVVSAFTASAVASADAVSAARGDHRVARHLATQTRDENAEAVERWLEDPACSLLFCDASAEEGINLQAAAVMIHLELPWDVFRLEQRIGRSDRFTEADAGPVESQIVMYGDQPYAREWFAFAADACGVFDRSVSSLQHVLADVVSALAGDVLTGGPTVIDQQFDARLAELTAEAQRIAAHDALDAVSEGHSESNERLLLADADPTFGNAVAMWLAGVGSKVRRPQPQVIELAPRPRPQVPFDVELAMSRWVGRPVALSRAATVERRDPILRAGNSLADAIATHLQTDDRGVAFAFLRPTAGHWPPTPSFRVDLLVTPLLGEDLLAAAEAAGLAGWLEQQAEALMPPIVERIDLLNGVEVDNAQVLRGYDKHKGDRNLTSRPATFEEWTSHLDWAATCEGAAAAALDRVATRPSIVEVPVSAATRLARELERRRRQTQARRAAGLEVDEGRDWASVAAAVPDRLGHQVRIIGCGAILHGDVAAAPGSS